MTYKLEYISRLLQRTNGKRLEHYVISRLWHRLDNFDVKMAPQQYVSRKSSKYALTDIYFPQFGFHVEVNEPAHYGSENRVNSDFCRQQEIEATTGHRVFVIDCRQNLSGIHSQIDKLVTRINSEIKHQIGKGQFKPWNPENEHNPNYWKSKGSINVSDEVSFYTIEDICLLFDADFQKTKRGFLRKGVIANPINPNQIIWWPSERSRRGWVNSYNDIEGTFTETHSDPQKKIEHYASHQANTHIRIAFFRYKDILGLTNYKFVGVFTNDKQKSNAVIGTVWKRIGNNLNLVTTEYV